MQIRTRLRSLASSPPAVRRGAVLGLAVAGGLVLFWPRHGVVDFNREVRPILNNQCIACHGGVTRAGGFGLLFREDALVQTESGRYGIVPGNPGRSEMIRRITHPDEAERMPRDGQPLTRDQIRILRRWIQQGAHWEDHWAYLQPEPRAPPRVADAAWPENGIDAFVLARLEAERLKPSPPADCAARARRVSLDLIGLPPTPDVVATFCADPSNRAYADLVDRLLESDRFGEHWASMWLDLARYADTKGYEKDQHRDIWSYRDWVIRALNRDMPFDRFTIEQIAGDLLPGATDEQILATAFHRNTMTNDEDGTDDEEFRIAAVIDRVNTTFEVWQGTTMGCVQCHSHPYDPFRHEEYFQLFAFFNNTADHDRKDDAPRLATYDEPERRELTALLARVDELRGPAPATDDSALSNRVERVFYPLGWRPAASFGDAQDVMHTADFVAPLNDGAWVRYDGVDLGGIGEIGIGVSGSVGAIELRLGSPEGRQIGRLALTPPPPRPAARPQTTQSAQPSPPRPAGPPRPTRRSMEPMQRVPIESVTGSHSLFLVLRTEGNARFRVTSFSLHPARAEEPAKAAEIAQIMQRLIAVRPEAETPVLRELPPDRHRVTQVFEGGNWLVRGDTVQPGVPGSLPPMAEDAQPNRLALAQWLVSKENPLTARVIVNRFWAHLFGTGIVETLEDFGTMGAEPSHPELLDWLALRFMNEHGWSIKSLLREIVFSATYQQASRVPPELLERDPYNRLLARGPRVRLSGEQIRDQALMVGGLLSTKMFGPSVMPPQPPGLWSSPYNELDWVTSPGEDRFRRAIYTYWKRTAPYPSFLTFDAPTREFCVSRRIRTNTPLQALVTLNDPVFVEAGQALAQWMATAGTTADERLRRGFQRALLRDPDHATMATLRALYDEAVGFYREQPELLDDAVRPYRPYDGPAAYAANGYTQDNRDPDAYGSEPAPETVEVAALATVAGAILNLDGFLTKE